MFASIAVRHISIRHILAAHANILTFVSLTYSKSTAERLLKVFIPYTCSTCGHSTNL